MLPQALAHRSLKEELVRPDELLPCDALMLARAETEEDFVRALKAKSRLGRFLV